MILPILGVPSTSNSEAKEDSVGGAFRTCQTTALGWAGKVTDTSITPTSVWTIHSPLGETDILPPSSVRQLHPTDWLDFVVLPLKAGGSECLDLMGGDVTPILLHPLCRFPQLWQVLFLTCL